LTVKADATPLVVIIATAGRPVLLERTLASLARCTIPDCYEGTVVVENGPRAGTETVVDSSNANCPALSVRYLHEQTANKSRALNRALGAVGEGLVLFLDDDVRVHDQLLVRYAEAARGLRGGAFFGSSCGVDYEVRPPEWFIPVLPYSARGMDLKGSDRLWEYLGCSWAAFAADLREAGRFDPDLGPGAAAGAGGQETDMQRRLAALGASRIDLPEVLVWHWVPQERCSRRWVLKRRFREGISSTLARRRSGDGRLALLAGILRDGMRNAASVAWHAARRDRTRMWAGLGGMFAMGGRVKGLLLPGATSRAVHGEDGAAEGIRRFQNSNV